MGSSLRFTQTFGLVGGWVRGLSSDFAPFLDVELCDVAVYAAYGKISSTEMVSHYLYRR